ncbi:hypothetical protein IW262DRAFT_1531588 [Armillaria fumosa]|nr:hypothetical protein IW262DRAFT_1531588 [Armillaria fumosa]
MEVYGLNKNWAKSGVESDMNCDGGRLHWYRGICLNTHLMTAGGRQCIWFFQVRIRSQIKQQRPMTLFIASTEPQGLLHMPKLRLELNPAVDICRGEGAERGYPISVVLICSERMWMVLDEVLQFLHMTPAAGTVLVPCVLRLWPHSAWRPQQIPILLPHFLLSGQPSQNLSPLNATQCITLNGLEVPIDHSQSITMDTFILGTCPYTFHPTELDPTTLMITNFSHSSNAATTAAYFSHIDDHMSKELADYCRHFVLVNEDSSKMVGELDKKNNPVIIEVPEGQTVDDKHPLQLFACAVPLDQQDWITKSAVIVSTLTAPYCQWEARGTIEASAMSSGLLDLRDEERAYFSACLHCSGSQEDGGEQEERESQAKLSIYPRKQELVTQYQIRHALVFAYSATALLRFRFQSPLA